MAEAFSAHAIVIEALGDRRFVRVQLPYPRRGLRALQWGMEAAPSALAAVMTKAAQHAQMQARRPFARRDYVTDDASTGAPWTFDELLEGGVVVSLHRSRPYGVLIDVSLPHRVRPTFAGVERVERPLRTSLRKLAEESEVLVRWSLGRKAHHGLLP